MLLLTRSGQRLLRQNLIGLYHLYRGGNCMKTRLVLYADEGKVLTDGNIYGTEIYLAENVSADSYREITTEEYENILNKQTEEGVLDADK